MSSSNIIELRLTPREADAVSRALQRYYDNPLTHLEREDRAHITWAAERLTRLIITKREERVIERRIQRENSK